MSCPYGYIKEVYEIGVNPKEMKDKDSCTIKRDADKKALEPVQEECNNLVQKSFKATI